MYAAYSVLTLLVFILVSPYFLYQAIRYKKYIGSLRQRLGLLPVTINIDGEQSVWIHAVSVGEVLTARALAADLKALYPRLRLFLSTTTIAGGAVDLGTRSFSSSAVSSRSTPAARSTSTPSAVRSVATCEPRAASPPARITWRMA